MNFVSNFKTGKLREWIGLAAQASAGLPPLYAIMDHVLWSTWKGLITDLGYDHAVLVFILVASVMFVASIILLAIGRLFLGRWHRELVVMNATLYGVMVILGITIEYAARNIRDCGKPVC